MSEIVTGGVPFAWAEGLAYSQAVRVGDLVFSSGQGGFGADGELVEGGAEEQTRQAFRNLEASLATHGATLASIAKLTVYLVDLGDYDAFRRARGDALSAPYPASTAVLAGGLLVEGMVVELDAIAVVGSERTAA